jgi:hypothetical protein
MIQVLNAIYGGERFVGDGLETIIDLGSHLPGFCLDHTGKLKASGAEISGHIEATSGTFHGRVEADEGIFKGSIMSGPLILVDETPISSIITYAAETAAYDIVNTELSRKGITPNPSLTQNWSFNILGTYAGNNIVVIRFYFNGTLRRVYVTYQDGTEVLIATTSSTLGNTLLSSQLSFAYTSGGKTFRLTDLPTQDPHIPGAAWRNGSQLMISV